MRLTKFTWGLLSGFAFVLLVACATVCMQAAYQAGFADGAGICPPIIIQTELPAEEMSAAPEEEFY